MDTYWPAIVIVIQLIFLEGILSIDNAAVLGALVAPLPNDQSIPWPRWLLRFGKWVNPLLGNQRNAALRVGLLGAYLGRGLMLLVASFLINNPWIRLVGAAYLIRLACYELGDTNPAAETEQDKRRAIENASFWSVVLVVEVTDLIFSIDNVVAAVSLSDEFWVVIVGVSIGILTMRFAAGIFSYAVQFEPLLKQAAYLLILNIGIQLILDDVWHIHVTELQQFGISVVIIAATLAYAHFPILHKLDPLLWRISQLMGLVNTIVDWLLWPFRWLLGWFSRQSRSSTEASSDSER